MNMDSRLAITPSSESGDEAESGWTSCVDTLGGMEPGIVESRLEPYSIV